jgi:hypothetical protein
MARESLPPWMRGGKAQSKRLAYVMTFRSMSTPALTTLAL